LKEEVFQERFYQENKSVVEAKIEDLEFYLKDTFTKLWRFFSFVAIAGPLEKHKAYMTSESLQRQLPKYWGHDCDFLALNLFRVISEGQELARIYMHQFVDRVYKVLTCDNYRDRMKFCFSLLDFDGDGIVKA
jgi:hypothetical protein